MTDGITAAIDKLNKKDDTPSSEQYVYEGTVVVQTGRTADKQIVGRRNTSVVTLHEVTPAETSDGSWKKWVNLADLYKIAEDNNNNGSTS